LAVNNEARHFRLGDYGANRRRWLVDLNRLLAGFLKLVKDGRDRYFSTGRRATKKLLNPRNDPFSSFQPDAVPIIRFVACQDVSLMSRLPLRQLLRKAFPSWVIKRWHGFSRLFNVIHSGRQMLKLSRCRTPVMLNRNDVRGLEPPIATRPRSSRI